MNNNPPIPLNEFKALKELERIWKIKFTTFERLAFSHSVGHVEQDETRPNTHTGLTNLRHEMLLELMRLKAIMRRHAITQPEELQEVCNGIVVYNGHVVGLGLYLIPIETIPDVINQLPELRILCFNSNEIESISENIGDLWFLRTLKITHNNLRNLPPTIQRLKHLKILNVNGNHLEAIPNEIGNLTELNELDISSNAITNFPPNYCNLTTLQELNIAENRITSIPSSFDKLQNLLYCDCHLNPIQFIPESMGSLYNLTRLNLSQADLSSIPHSFINLRNLQKLELNDNHFTTIPNALNNLPNLTELKLNNNEIEEIPDDFCKSMRIEILELKNNHISKISYFINLLPLKSLNLSQNYLVQLPDSLANLKHLETLLLSQNRFRDIPSILHDLLNLVNLEMGDNPFGSGLPDGLQWQRANIMHYLERRFRLYLQWGPQKILEKLQQNIPLDDVDRTHPDFIKFLSFFIQYMELFHNSTSNELNALIDQRAMISQGQYAILL